MLAVHHQQQQHRDPSMVGGAAGTSTRRMKKENTTSAPPATGGNPSADLRATARDIIKRFAPKIVLTTKQRELADEQMLERFRQHPFEKENDGTGREGDLLLSPGATGEAYRRWFSPQPTLPAATLRLEDESELSNVSNHCPLDDSHQCSLRCRVKPNVGGQIVEKPRVEVRPAKHHSGWNASVSLEPPPKEIEFNRSASTAILSSGGSSKKLIDSSSRSDGEYPVIDNGSITASQPQPEHPPRRLGERKARIVVDDEQQQPHPRGMGMSQRAAAFAASAGGGAGKNRNGTALGEHSAVEIGLFDARLVQEWEAESRWVLERMNFPLRWVAMDDASQKRHGGQSSVHRGGGGTFPNPLADPCRNGVALNSLLCVIRILRRDAGEEQLLQPSYPQQLFFAGRPPSNNKGKPSSSSSMFPTLTPEEARNNWVQGLSAVRRLSEDSLANDGVAIPHSFLHLKIEEVLRGHLQEFWGLIHYLLIYFVLPYVQPLGVGALRSLDPDDLVRQSSLRKSLWLEVLPLVPRFVQSHSSNLSSTPNAPKTASQPFASSYSDANLAKLNRSVCQFLFANRVVYDIVTGDESDEAAEMTVPQHTHSNSGSATNPRGGISSWRLNPQCSDAPYISYASSRGGGAITQRLASHAPISIADPNVLPFLANGTMLIALVNRLFGTELPIYKNPRMPSRCFRNVQIVLEELRKRQPRISGKFLHHEEPVLHGDIVWILCLLEDVMRLATKEPARRGDTPSLKSVPFLWEPSIPLELTGNNSNTNKGPHHQQQLGPAATTTTTAASLLPSSAAGSASWVDQNFSSTLLVHERRQNGFEAVPQQSNYYGATPSSSGGWLASASAVQVHGASPGGGLSTMSSAASPGGARLDAPMAVAGMARGNSAATMSTHRIANTHLLMRQNSHQRELADQGGVTPGLPPAGPSSSSTAHIATTAVCREQSPEEGYTQMTLPTQAPVQLKSRSRVVSTGAPSSGRSVVASNEDVADIFSEETDESEENGIPQPEAAYNLYLSSIQLVPAECEQLRSWLFSKLGGTFSYHSSRFQLHRPEEFSFSNPCNLFYDGVILADLLRILNYHKLPQLDSVQRNPKSAAARRFNLRRCIEYLQGEKKMLAHYLGMDEALEAGDLRAVILLLRELKAAFKHHRGPTSPQAVVNSHQTGGGGGGGGMRSGSVRSTTGL